MLEQSLQTLRGRSIEPNADFPYAPLHWTPEEALRLARNERINLSNAHWETIRALQEYFARNADEHVPMRKLHDALEEHFHAQGGIKFLYQIFPRGPVAQGCRLAGLPMPASAQDLSFGSVM